MAIYKYVVDKDWDSQQITDIVSYKGAGQNFTFGTDGFASIYETILDANDIAVPGAVGADAQTPSPVPYTEARQTIFVVKGDFEEDVLAAADAKYTLDFQSIYGAPDPTDPEAEDLRTKFVGSIVSEAANDVGIRVSSGVVFFGEDDNRTTITLNRTVDGSVGQWADSEFVVGGALAGQDAVEATAIVNNTDLTVAHWIWVGSQNDVHQSADDAVVNYLFINNSAVNSTTLQVRNTGSLVVVDSTVNTTAMVLRHNASFLDSTITVGATGNFNVYGENGVTATLTLAGTENGGSVLTAEQTLLIGKPDSLPNDEGRKGEVKLIKSSIGYVIPDNPETTNVDEYEIVRSGNIAVKQNGSITMDAASKIYASALTNDGAINITIDAAGEDWINATSFTNTAETGKINIGGSFDGGVKRVIYATSGEVKVADIVVTATSETGEDVTAATRAGKVALAAGVDYTTIYLSNAIDEDDDFAKEVTDTQDVSYYVDFNAFQLPASALEDGVKPVTTTILIDGTDREALDYVGTTTASIDGLTFAKDGTNGVAAIPAVEDDPLTDEDETAAAVDAVPEENVKFVLSGMDPTDPGSYRELKKGITVEEGVTFTADKLYQSGKDAVTTIKGELKMGTYVVTPAIPDDPDTDEDESQDAVTAPDTFQVAGGKVNVTSTGSLTGAGIVSVIATLRDDAGKPIKAEMNVTGAPINLSKLEIGANSTVTLKDIEANEDGTSKAVFGNVVMRKTTVSDFTGPVLTIINSQVDVTNSFDTTKGLVNINFQSQLFVKTANATIEGGTLNLTVTEDDVTLLSNYGKTDPATGELVVPQPKMFYTIVHAAISDEVVLTCDGDVDGDGYIDGTKYIYTDLGGQGLYVMHEDVAKALYVNVAWENASTGDIVGEGMFYNINAFSTFTDALNVAKDNKNYDTSITVLSDVTETYGADLFYKETIPGSTAATAVYFNSNITVKAGEFDEESGTVIYPTENPASWTVQYVNTAEGRMDLCISPAGAVEDDPETTDKDESKPAKTFVVENGVKIFMGGEVEDPELPEPIVSGPTGIWLDFWGQGAGVTVNSDVTADMVGAKGTATITEDATITARDLVIRAGEKGENKTVTIIGKGLTADPVADPNADPVPAQITVSCLNFVDGILNVTDSVVVSDRLLFTDDNVIGNPDFDLPSGSFVLNSDNTVWTISSDDGVYNYFYQDHPEDEEEKPTFTAELNFTNGSVLDTKAINNVIAGSTSGYAGHATPMTINFEDSELIVGSTVANAGAIELESSTATFNGAVTNSGTIEFDESTASITGSLTNNGGEIEFEESEATITGRIFNKAGGVIDITKGDDEDDEGSTVIVGSTVTNEKGTINITESSLTAAAVVNGLAGSNSKGSITVDGGELTLTATSNISFNNNRLGTVTVQNGGVVTTPDTKTINNYGVFTLNGATINGKISNAATPNVANSHGVVNINGAATVTRGITNSSHKGRVVFGISNNTDDVKVNITGGTVQFSKEELTFDMAVTGVKNAGTADEAIASAKLSGGTVFANQADLILTDSGFKVIDQAAVPDDPEQEGDQSVAEEFHMVWNDTNFIKIGASGSLTLDDVEGWDNSDDEYDDVELYDSLVVTGLDIAAGGLLTMDWSQCLTVNGDLNAETLPGGSAIEITLNPLDVYTSLDTDKLVIAYDGFMELDDYSFVKNYEEFFTVHYDEEDFVNGLYLDASKFVKVSQDHTFAPEDGWYKQFNTVPGSQDPEDQGAVDSEASVVLGIDGSFTNVFLKDKVTMIVGSADEEATLTFGGIFAGGFDVSAMEEDTEYVTAGPATLNLKIHEGETNVAISAGTFSNAVVVGGDLVKVTGEETKVNYYRVGDINTVIDGGIFEVTSAGGQRMIVGGEYYQAATKDGVRVSIGAANLTGDVNLTISGGSFTGYDVYGGNYANQKTFGKYATIDGNVTVTLDSSENALVFDTNGNGTQGGKIFAGSFGAGAITGDTKVILSGGEDITFEKLFGGSTGDFRSTSGTLESNVEGKRILSFTGFTGDLNDDAVIDGFNTVEISGVNELNFDVTDLQYFNLDVTNWTFAADAEVSGTFAFDFTGDKVDMSALDAGWELSNVTFNDKTQFAFAAGIDFEYDAESKLFSLVSLS